MQIVFPALTPVEQRYSETEQEALESVWGVEHFRLYLFGAPFILITDHKPLQLIYNNFLSRPPTRIERWLLRLTQYNLQVFSYQVASTYYLSRHPQSKTSKRNVAEQYVNFVAVNATLAAIPVKVIKEHTTTDKSLEAVSEPVELGDRSSNFV